MDVASVASRLHLECVICQRKFTVPYRVRHRVTCSAECQCELLAKHANGRRNTSGQFVCEDESGRQPHDPTPEQIAARALEIKERNLREMAER